LSQTIHFDRLKQIHVEAYFYDDVWALIKSFPNPSWVTWYVMAPVNYNYFRAFYPLKKSWLDSKMSKRVRWMSEHNYPIGLHIHFYWRGNMSIGKKREMFAEALSWGAKNQIAFRKFVPGWFHYTADFKKLCDSFNLQLIGKEPYTHDYQLEEFKAFLVNDSI